GERQLETLARGALRARVAEEVRVGAGAGAGGGLVRARAAVTLGLACAVAARRLLVAAGRFASRRRALLPGGGFGAGRRLRRDRPALLGVARVREPISARRCVLALGARTPLGALHGVARALAILAPEPLPDALRERARQARERPVVLVGPGEQHEAGRRRPSPPGYHRDAARGVGGHGRGGARLEPGSDQQREQEGADGGERAGEGAAWHALGDEPLGAPRGQPADIVLHRSEERRVGKECRSRWSRDQ